MRPLVGEERPSCRIGCYLLVCLHALGHGRNGCFQLLGRLGLVVVTGHFIGKGGRSQKRRQHEEQGYGDPQEREEGGEEGDHIEVEVGGWEVDDLSSTRDAV